MKTVGTILSETRKAKGLTLDQVEHATKIRKRFLQALEEDDYSGLPSLSYAKGFVKNYGNYLGLNSENVLAFFRRQTRDVPRSSLLPKGVADPLNISPLRLTPNRFLIIIVATLVSLFLLYFGLQYRKLQLPPSLTVEAPKDVVRVTDRRIDVLGKTDPDATVTINGVSVLIRSDGQFFDQVGLESGENTITITSTSRYGKSITLTRKIFYQPS